MTCKQIRHYLDGLLVVEPTATLKQAVDEHISQCSQCRAEYDAAMNTLALLRSANSQPSSNHLKERIMNSALSATPRESVSRNARWSVWKPALAAAAACAVLVLLVYPLLQPAGSYAFAQTLDATRSVRSIHLRTTPAAFGSVGEIWARFNDNAELVQLRMNFPDTEDGPKDVLWENDKAQVWFRQKNSIATVLEPNLLAQLKVSYDFFDPARTVQSLYDMNAQGVGDIEIEEPAAMGGAIRIRAGAGKRLEVYTVDPETKLLLRRDIYTVAGGQEQLQSSTEYLDYNAVDPAAFVLEAPQDVMRVDMTQGVGLEQGSLTDGQVAVEVARQFFEALIARDYEKASPLASGIPAAKLREMLEPLGIDRIVSIGQPAPHEPTSSLRVPCKIERQIDGRIEIYEPEGPFVRQVHGRPGYWSIIGGI